MDDKLSPPTPDRTIVVGVGLKSDPIDEVKESLAELEELVYAAGGEVTGVTHQILEKYHSSTLIGSGKITELKALVEETDAKLVVVDHQLSGVQGRNLEKELNARVLDRSQLILDIFAQRAQTYEGKLQVELAQMMDQLPRMVGGWLGSLSRQGGGIGTRGPGESALEMDRRRIRDKIKGVKNKLAEVRKNRVQHRNQRIRNKIPSFALIGYTNSGKSTLINSLTHSDVLAKDQVFATLDPTTRKIYLPEIGQAVITDTVGFIRRLPTHLIEAFKSTLEESAEADVLLHVIDLSNPSMQKQIEVVDQLITEFKWDNKPIIYVINKSDIGSPENQMSLQCNPRILVSAKDKIGLEQLKAQMCGAIMSTHEEYELFFSAQEEQLAYDLSRVATIVTSEKASTGTVYRVTMSPTQLGPWKKYLT